MSSGETDRDNQRVELSFQQLPRRGRKGKSQGKGLLVVACFCEKTMQRSVAL